MKIGAPVPVCVLVCALITGAYGITANASDDFTELSIEELMQVQVPIVTSASKFAQKATDAPAAITVITQEEIQRYGYRTLAEVLQSVRGVHVTSEGRYDYAGIRGFSPPGDYKSGLLLLIDGRRANENIYGSAHLGTDALVDVDLIDHVEIVRGPASAIYGKGAFYGVINVVTRRPTDFGHGEVSTSAGSEGSYKTRFTLGHRFKTGFEFLLSGSLYESAGQRDLYFKEFDSPETNRGRAHKLDYDRGHDGLLKLAYGDFSLQAGYKWRATGLPNGAYGVVFNDPRNRQEDEHGYVELKYTHDFNGWAVEARTSLNHYQFQGFYPYAGDPDSADPVVMNFDQTTGAWWMGELQVSHKLLQHHFTLGADFQENLKQDQKNYDISPVFVYADSRQSSSEYGLFLQDEYRLSKTITLTGAGRYDWYTGSDGDLSLRFGAIYQPTKKTSIKLLYGDAFRPPTAFEAYYQTEGIDPGLPLQPERIRSYEAVLEQELTSNLRLTTTAFINHIDDLIDFGPDLFYVNGGGARTEGAEIEIEGRWARGIRTRASYTWQQSHYRETGAELFNSPRHLGKLNLIVPFFNDKVSLGFELQGVSSARTLSGAKADPYAVGNVTLFSRRLLPNLELSGSVYNVFDQRYGSPGGPDFPQDVHIQEGRSFRVKATFSF